MLSGNLDCCCWAGRAERSDGVVSTDGLGWLKNWFRMQRLPDPFCKAIDIVHEGQSMTQPWNLIWHQRWFAGSCSLGESCPIPRSQQWEREDQQPWQGGECRMRGWRFNERRSGVHNDR